MSSVNLEARHERRREGWQPVAIFIATLVATALICSYVWRVGSMRDRMRAEREADRLQLTAEATINTYITVVRGEAAFMESGIDRIDARVYEVFVSRFHLEQRYPGMLGLGFSRRLDPPAVPRFVEDMRAQGFPEYHAYPATPRPEIHAIQFLEPQNRRNRVALGYDMFTDPIRRSAMERARDSGHAAASRRVTLVQEIEPQKQAGFLIYLPVYSPGPIPRTTAERRSRLIGCAYAPFRGDDLFYALLHDQLVPGVEIAVYASPDASPSTLMHSSRLGHSGNHALERRRRIRVADSDWTLVLTTTAAFDAASERRWIPALAATGFLIAFVFFLLTRSLVRGRVAREWSERKLRSLVNATTSIVWTTEASGDMAQRFPSWEAFTGQETDQYIGWRWAEAIHPEDRDSVVRAWQQAIGSRERLQLTYRLLHRSGEYRWVQANGVPVMNASGEVVEWIATATDIHDRLAAEQAAREASERFRFLAESMEQKIFTAKPGGELDYLNRQWVEFTGLSFEQIRSWGWRHFVHPTDVDENMRRWDESVASGNPFQLEHRFRRADGVYRWHLTRAHPMRDEDGHIVMWIGSNTDIDDQKRVEEALERLYTEAESANRAKDEFLATVSHELRTPMTAILGWSRLLRMGRIEPEMLEEGLHTIERSAQTQAQLIEDLLDVSRIVSGKLILSLETVSVATILQEAMRPVVPAAEAKRIAISTTIPPDLPMLRADLTRLQQVFWNLLTNAVKFTPAGGRVAIHAQADEETVMVEVSDNGRGIGRAFLPHLFQRFRQEESSSTRTHSGLGIGLALVKQIVEMHGGTVEAESEGEGTGSTFRVVLPVQHAGDRTLATEWVPLASADPRASGGPSIAGLRILLVDDDADARRVVGAMLDWYGAQVTVVSSAAEAVARWSEGFDVLVSDIAMPERDGYGLLADLQRATPGRAIPAIAVTASGRDADRGNALAAGFSAHLVKPVEPADLVAAIAECAAAAS